MPLTSPTDGVIAVLSAYGPMTTVALGERVEDAEALLGSMDRAGLVERLGDRWRITAAALRSDRVGGEGKEHAALDAMEVEQTIRFEIGQLPPYLVQRLRSKDRSERAAAKEEVTKRISRKFEGLSVYGPEAAPYPLDHIR